MLEMTQRVMTVQPTDELSHSVDDHRSAAFLDDPLAAPLDAALVAEGTQRERHVTGP